MSQICTNELREHIGPSIIGYSSVTRVMLIPTIQVELQILETGISPFHYPPSVGRERRRYRDKVRTHSMKIGVISHHDIATQF